ncbi:XdhC family protein [Pantoea sp. EA-12]|uniref:XdhC family protein n=1 Tax=Pantoea sp. EA-12 TaxID=3043303 RepID=UPI0024B5C241|nr:XdhC family protein [Pantoea sp. EA-12]MDI9221517.1 XdhC family protein [Pantoea sp. EA-12]
MHHLDVQVLNAALAWAEEHPVWLCTVLSTFGSSPRPPGAMMVIRSDGRYCGSLSGGCVEESFIARIGDDIFSSPSQIVRYGDGGFEPDQALPCGGALDILVEKLMPVKASIGYLRQMMSALTGPHSVVKALTIPEPCRSLLPGGYLSRTHTQVQGANIVLTLCAPPRVVIAGLSSVALYCANFAQALGFETLVCEHREDVLLNLADQLDDSVKLIKQFPASYLEREGCHSGTAILSLTHNPRIDDLTMMEAVNLPAFYIGAMGSQNNSLRRKERLVRIGELNPEEINRIHAPIGMDIGSKTPAEIALSIMADVVSHKNGLMGSAQDKDGAS